ncbi:MAG: hypothetical protein U9Q74_05245, partial [Gemmatimonadota bacterium]|nr:hypothetical protein [Gemmatimonadota bacterium]
MTAALTKYAEAFGAVESAAGAPAWLAELRKAAHAEFSAIGFPTTRNEDWHYTSVTPIAERTFRALKPTATPAAPASTAEPSPADLVDRAVGEASWPRAVFVNGRFESALSSLGALGKGVRVSTLTAALKEQPDFVAAHLGKLAAWNTQAFTAFNTAFAQDGLVVHVPRGTKVEAPLHVIHVADAQAAGCMIHPRLLVVVEPLAEFAI